MPRFQSELFDGPSLTRRLRLLGVRGVADIEVHENRAVVVSVTPRGVLRVHRGFAYAPDPILEAIATFVDPRATRRRRQTAQRRILAFPVHAFVPAHRRPRRRAAPRAGDRALLTRLRQLFAELNAAHFDGTLSAVPLRVSHRMRRRLGDLSLDPATDRPLAITVSADHVTRDGWAEVTHTLLHEMVHQWQAEQGLPVDHGAIFRRKARAVGIEPRAARRIRRS